jgi:hypothetical protein
LPQEQQPKIPIRVAETGKTAGFWTATPLLMDNDCRLDWFS